MALDGTQDSESPVKRHGLTPKTPPKTPRSRHEPLYMAAIHAFSKVAPLIPQGVPVVLETPVTRAEMRGQIDDAHLALSVSRSGLFAFG